MAFLQIVTSVTIINSGLIGYSGISLTNFTTSAASNIASGSGIEIAGAFFKADADVIPNASSWTVITTATTTYLGLTPSGTAGSMLLTASWLNYAPTWSTSKQGWYASTSSNIRVVASAYKEGATRSSVKRIINNLQSNTLYGNDNLPTGTILMYNGASWVDNVTLSGWYACTTANSAYGVPALTNKFIMGALASGATGGNNSVTEVLAHSHGVTDPGHIHSIYVGATETGSYNVTKWIGTATPSQTSTYSAITGISINSTGAAAPDNRPSYYSVIYIMKCF